MRNIVTTVLTKDDAPVWLYFIDGVLYENKTFENERDAFEAGLNKVTEIKASELVKGYKKRKGI